MLSSAEGPGEWQESSDHFCHRSLIRTTYAQARWSFLRLMKKQFTAVGFELISAWYTGCNNLHTLTYLPSTTWLATLLPLIALGAIGGIFFVLHGDEENTQKENEQLLAINSFSSAALSNTDADADGLKDWEERLWGTDSGNADSDNDGTPDGEEVEQNRNPAKAGPDDAIAGRILPMPQSATTSSSGAAHGLTTEITQQMFVDYLALRQDGTLSPTDINQIVDSSLKRTASAIKTPKVSASSFNLITQPTSADAATYKSSLRHILTPLNSLTQNEFVLARQMVTTGNESLQNEILTAAKSYEQVANGLIKIPVPSEVANAHAEITNAYFFMAEIDRAVANAMHDPLSAMVYAQLYPSINEKIAAATNQLSIFFNKYNI